MALTLMGNYLKKNSNKWTFKKQFSLKSVNLGQLEGKKTHEFDINKMGVLWRQCSAALVATSLFQVKKLYYI